MILNGRVGHLTWTPLSMLLLSEEQIKGRNKQATTEAGWGLQDWQSISREETQHLWSSWVPDLRQSLRAKFWLSIKNNCKYLCVLVSSIISWLHHFKSFLWGVHRDIKYENSVLMFFKYTAITSWHAFFNWHASCYIIHT